MTSLRAILHQASRVPMGVFRMFEGIWTVPLALALLGIALALAVMPIGRALGYDGMVNGADWIDPEGGRAALSAVASGVMGIAGIVFSLTFVALTITAQQLSPRILDYVVRERVTQVLIGLALATFLFATISLAIGSGGAEWRLRIAVPIALLLASATLATVVVFGHGMTKVMRIEEMVARLGAAFVAEARALAAPPDGCQAVRLPETARHMLEEEMREGREVRATGAGYVARIDCAALLELAAAQDLVIRLAVRENDHILPGISLARVLGAHGEAAEVARAIEAAIDLTDRRMPSGRADYEAAALSEAALRALSPSLNDPATAISCLNRIFEGLAVLAETGSAPEVLGGANRLARLILPSRRIVDFLEGAVLPIAVAAQADYRVRRRILTLLAHLGTLVEDPADRAGIVAFTARVEAAAGPEFTV